MTRMRVSGMIAIFCCIVVLLFSIGHVSGLEGDKDYEAPDLMLTQGQAKYDLCDRISYDEDEYELSVIDQGGFDINVPGNYTVTYQLAVLDPDVKRESRSEETLKPKETAGPKETTGMEKTTGTRETTGVKETTASKETTVPEESGSKETTTANETTVPEATAAPETTVPEATVAPETTGSEATSAPETAGPDEPTSSKETAAESGEGNATAPAETAESSASSGTVGQGESTDSSEAAAPDIDAGSKETAAQNDISAQEQPDTPEAPHEAEKVPAGSAAMNSQGDSASVFTVFSSGALHMQGQEKTAAVQMDNGKLLLTEAMHGVDAAQKQEDSIAPSQPSEPQTTQAQENPTAPSQPLVPQTTQAQENPTAPSQPLAPQTTQAQENPAAPSQPLVPQTTQAQENPAAPSQPLAPQTTQTQEQGTAPAKTPEKASSSQADPNRETITFTRTVVVKDAVQYQDARYDVDTVTNLLTGMDFDRTHYSLSVLDDGGFNGSRINEYHIVYRLVNTDNGKKVADLERYVWITAPGVTFDAPDLELRLSQTGYDLQEGIDYDSTEYSLTTVNPESVDTSQTGELRVMFQMTAVPEDIGLPEDTGLTEASPAQAEPSVTEEPSAQRTTDGPGAADAQGTTDGPGAADSQGTADNQGTTSGLGISDVTVDSDDIYTTKGKVAVPVVAVFGRNVTIEDEPVVVITAPPLVIRKGTEGEHSLLEGVTATDEDGNPVPLEVANRSALDAAAAGLAAPGQATPGQAAVRSGGSGQETEGASFDQNEPGIPDFYRLLTIEQPIGFESNSTGQSEGSAQSGGENADIPANLPAGTYNVVLTAIHPVTGETFAMTRSVSVREETLLNLLDASEIHTVDVSKDHRPIYLHDPAWRPITLHLTGTGWLDPLNFAEDSPQNPGTKLPATYSPITVSSLCDVNIILDDGANIMLVGTPGVDGGSGNEESHGGGAGIYLMNPAIGINRTLTISGNGKLTAIGGNAGKGGLATGQWMGGAGGGGAGAGIGGFGGNGGAGGVQGSPDGKKGKDGVSTTKRQLVITAPNVTIINGKGNSDTPMTRVDGAASGGGGMGVSMSSWDSEIAGGAGGGGGGAGGSQSLRSYGGFGQGYTRFAGVSQAHSGDGGLGGSSSPSIMVALDARGNWPRLWFPSLEAVFKYIKQDAPKGLRKDYTVTLLGDYMFDASGEDVKALQALTGLGNDIKVTLTGLDTKALDPSQKKYNLTLPPGGLPLPVSPDASASLSFVIQNIGLKPGPPFSDMTIAADGSKLTVGTGVDFQKGTLHIWGCTTSPTTSTTLPSMRGDVTVYENKNSYGELRGTNRWGDHCVLTVKGQNVSAAGLYDWDTVNIWDNAALSSPTMDLCRNFQSAGLISLGAGSKLSVPPGAKAGSLATTGSGAALEFTGRPGADIPAALVLSGTATMNLTAHPLKLSYAGGAAPANGDKLIQFSPTVSNARTEDYISGFGDNWMFKADKALGLLTLEKHAVRVDYPQASGKTGDFYGSLGRAMDAVRAYNPAGGKTGTYTFTLLSDYILDQADNDAFAKATDLPTAVTVVITGKDAENPAAPISKLTLSADMMLPLGSAGSKGAAYELRDVAILDNSGWCIAANGSKLTLGDGITTSANSGGNYPNVIAGIFERTDKERLLTFTGNTWLEVRSGTYGNIVGGNWHQWSSSTTVTNPAVSTVIGNTDVSVKGTASAQMICGGSYINIGSTAFAKSERVGKSTVTFTGTAPNLNLKAGGSGPGSNGMVADTTTGVSQIVLENASVGTAYGSPGAFGNYLTQQGDMELTVKGNVNVGRVADFGAVRLTTDSSLTISGSLQRVSTYANDASKPAMLLDFQGRANLALNTFGDTYGNNKAGSFRIEGEGNTLTLLRATGAAIPLTLDRATPNVRVNNAQLTLRYPDGTAAKPGDKLLSFNPTKKNADASDYGPEIGGLAVMADKRSGYVYAGVAVTMQEVGGSLQPYASLALAMNAIGTGTGEYTVTFRREGYELTPQDGIALATQGGKAGKITYTSQFVTTSDDFLEPGETVGQQVTRTVVVGEGTTSSSPKSDLYLNSPNSFVKGIKFNYRQEGCSLYCNGNTITIGPHVEIISDAGYYPALYGGSPNKSVAKTDVDIQSGRYNGIYGGGREAGADVTGNASIKFGGDAELFGAIYGGGEAGNVTGTASVEITGGKALAADTASGAKNTIVGGGKTGTVGGSSVSVSGGTANGTIEIAGCDSGNVLGDVKLSVTEAPDSPPPKAALGNFYGASLRPGDAGAGKVTGSIQITITNGRDYGTIRGGKSEITGAGTSEITFKGGAVQVKDIMDFDHLNLGDPTPSMDKTTLFLTGKLQGAEGCLSFYDGSVLTLQGTSLDPADLVVKNIRTDETVPWSHLHMYKGPGAAASVSVSRPLNVLGENISAPGDKLVLGEYGPVGSQENDKVGEKGDRLLVFKNTANANVLQYISDLQGLDVVPGSTEPGVLMYGLSESPKMSLEKVSHTDQTGNVTQADLPGQSAVKTLTFLIQSFQDTDPTQPGGSITSAYVDTAREPDQAWAVGTGAIPGGGQEITVTQAAPNSVAWNGTVTMPILPPVTPAPSYYYAHVRDENNRVNTIVLDVHSPMQNGDAAVSRNGEGDYTFTVELRDLNPKDMGSSDIIYNVSGLKQLAWAAGKVQDAVPAGQTEALAPVMTQGTWLKQVITLNTPSIDSYSWTFTVPAADLGENPADMAVYLYAKDAMGNTGIYPIPLNDNRMDIQVPLWAGTVALRGGDIPRLIAPELYVVNWGDKPVKAELVGAEIPQDQGSAGDGKLLLTNKRNGPWASNELNLMVRPVENSPMGNYFVTTSVKDINPVTNALNLGTMPGRNEADHGVSFTFGALYDADNIIRTSGWSQCVLSYRFSLAAVQAPVAMASGQPPATPSSAQLTEAPAAAQLSAAPAPAQLTEAPAAAQLSAAPAPAQRSDPPLSVQPPGAPPPAAPAP